MIGEAIEVTGDEFDLDGLVECVHRRFGVLPTNVDPGAYLGDGKGLDPMTVNDLQSVRYEDETDALHAAFARGLRAYVRGFVDSKVDGTLEILEDREGDA